MEPLAFWTLAGLTFAPPQDARETCIGTVAGRDGTTVTNAQVVLVSSLIRHPTLGRADVVRARSDAKGRFRAALIENRLYSVWAYWTHDGRARISSVVDGACGGSVVRLTEATTSRTKPNLKVIGGEAWKKHGPLRFRVRILTDDPLVFDVRPVDGVVEIPPLPESASIDVLGKGGHTLTHAFLEGDTLRVSAPSATLGVHVVNQGGSPVSDALVVAHIYGDPVRTDENGQALLSLASAGPFVHVSKPGYRITSMTIPQQGSERSLRVELQASKRSRHRVLGREGKALVGARVFASWLHQTRLGSGPTNFTTCGPYSATTRADGSYHVPGPSDPARVQEPRVCVLLTDEHRSSYGVPKGFPLPPARVFHSGSLDLDLSEFGLLPIEFVAAGNPARGVRVSAMVPGSSDNASFASNRRGRVCLLLRRGSCYIEAWHRELGFAREKIRVQAGDATNETSKIQLLPFGVFAGRVRSAKGEAIAGADIWLAETVGHLDDTGLWNFGSRVNWRLLQAKSDAEGRFQLRFAPIAGLRWKLRFRSGSLQAQHEFGAAGSRDAKITLR